MAGTGQRQDAEHARDQHGAASPVDRPPSKAYLLVPFLFTVAPLVSFYAVNARELQPSQMLVPLAIGGAAVLLLTGAAYLVFRNAASAAVLVSACAIAFFNYGHVFDALSGKFIVHVAGFMFGPNVLLWLVVPCLLALVTWFVARHPERVLGTVKITSVVGIALVVAAAGAALVATWGMARGSVEARKAGSSVSSIVPTVPEEDYPDIYWIVLDGYASNDSLRKDAAYDNSAFTAYLQRRGFSVVPDSAGNYSCTALALPSMLSMDYVNGYLPDLKSGKTKNLYDLIRHSSAVHALKGQGYRYVHIGTGWTGTDSAPEADLILKSQTELTRVLVQTTMLQPLTYRVSPFPDKYSEISTAFRRLSALRAGRRPDFVFAHFLVPHEPYVFAADGSRATPKGVAVSGSGKITPSEVPGYYAPQVQATNSLVRDCIEDIVRRRSDRPLVIIIQGDHGPWDQGILSAFYSSRTKLSTLYPSISPVNYLRVVFNETLGTSLPLLEDRHYRSPDWYNPGDIVDVTDSFRGQ